MGRPALKVEKNEVFGMFRVINNMPIIKGGHSFVEVECMHCGNRIIKCVSDLKARRSTACKQCLGKRKQIPIKIGGQYGKWTVISGGLYGIRKNSVVYKCQCSCGNTSTLSSYELRSGKSTQCKQCGHKQAMQHNAMQRNAGNLTVSKYSRLKRIAETRKHVFLVEMQYLWHLYLSQNKQCAITGDYIEDINKASLDRIDSSIRYVVGNVQWVTKQANLSKHVMTLKELYDFCKKVLDHANQQPSTPLTKSEGSETNG